MCKTLSDRVHQLRFVNDYLANSASQQDYLASHLPLPHYIQWQYDNGIPVGKGKSIALTSAEIDDISFWLSSISGSDVSLQYVPVGGLSYKKLLKSNNMHNAMVYRVGETAAIQKYSDDSLEWMVEISKIFSLHYEENFYTFLKNSEQYDPD